MNLVFYLVGALLVFFALLYLISTRRLDPYDTPNTDALYNEIEQLEIYRNSIIEDIEAKKANTFPTIVLNVLDTYERSNIRIPADILEELARNGFTTETEVTDFIENQRHHWKLENSKKVYK